MSADSATTMRYIRMHCPSPYFASLYGKAADNPLPCSPRPRFLLPNGRVSCTTHSLITFNLQSAICTLHFAPSLPSQTPTSRALAADSHNPPIASPFTLRHRAFIIHPTCPHVRPTHWKTTTELIALHESVPFELLPTSPRRPSFNSNFNLAVLRCYLVAASPIFQGCQHGSRQNESYQDCRKP